MYPAAPLPDPRQRRGKGCPLASHFTRVLQSQESKSRGGGNGFFICVFFLCYQELEVSSIAQIHIHPESWKETLFENGVFA